MIRLTSIVTGELTLAQRAAAVTLVLPYEERVRQRLAAVVADGPRRGSAVALLLDAPRGSVLRDGTVLAGPDGALAIVRAAPQAVTRVTAPDALTLLRAVYHLANRHVPAQLALDAVLIERDPVLERMLAALGALIEHVDAPFDPEPGAYGGGHRHDSDAGDDPGATVGEQLSIAAHRARAEPA
jgi:urease accessory protein